MRFLYIILVIGLIGGILGYVYSPAAQEAIGILFFFIMAFFPPFIMDRHIKALERQQGGFLTPIDIPEAKFFGYFFGLITAGLLCRLLIYLLTILNN